jgi:uncharacterized membrane protein
MVSTECSKDEIECRLVIQPNRSLSWGESMVFISGAGFLLGTVGLVFAIEGYWMILPFAGAEVAALVYCTYRVADAGYRCEVVSIDAVQVLIEKGRRRRRNSARGGPETSVSFPRAWVRVELRPHHGWYPDRLLVGASGNFVELGAFLADDEKHQLAGELQRLLIKR